MSVMKMGVHSNLCIHARYTNVVVHACTNEFNENECTFKFMYTCEIHECSCEIHECRCACVYIRVHTQS